jgi:oxygen-independent coproporphyrinogen-3 oxidase
MGEFDTVDIELLRKYDQPGPRYTSYPTAPLFSAEFGPEEFEEEIRRTNQEGEKSDLSLYFHIPFCDTLCYFCGCTMTVTRDRNKIRRYLDYLEVEMDRVAAHLAPDRRVVQLHWGGGTPTTLEPDEIRRLGEAIHRRFRFAPEEELEASCEIDPRGLTEDHLVALRESGFNRLSMGVQDFDEKVQRAVNRVQPEAMTREVVEWSRKLGFQSINLDFIYGLPYQTLETFERTVEKIIDIAPDRIAVFNFAHVPWLKKHQRLIDPATLPSPETKLQILKLTIERLSQAGYWYIGMDHFAKPDDELAVAQRNKTLYRNFQGYSTKAGCDVYAFGMSSISQFRDVYAQNHKKIPDYYAALDRGGLATAVGYRLNRDDHIRRRVIMGLMCDFSLDFRAIEEEFGIRFREYFADSLPKLAPFVEDGLVELREDGIEVAPAGRLVIRNIAMCFDAYLEELRRRGARFSKTV